MKHLDQLSLFFWKRVVLALICISLSWYWFSGMMLFHVWDSPFLYKGADLTYWMVFKTGMYKPIVMSEFSAMLFTLVLFTGGLASFIWIRKRWITVVFGIMLLLYQILFNMKIGYHTHHLFGFQFALFPFYFRERSLTLGLGFARILACLTYFFAGFFKLWGKAWLYKDSFSNTIENQLAAYFYFQPEDVRTATAQWLVSLPLLACMVFIVAMLMQLSFALGFLSRKYDLWLAFCIISFHVMDWFLMNLGIFMSMTVMVYLFLYKEKVQDAGTSMD